MPVTQLQPTSPDPRPAGFRAQRAWRALYRATRPKVERKIAHMMRRKHGGRRARTRGRLRLGHDFALLATAVNVA